MYVIWNRVLKSLTEKMAFEQRLKGDETLKQRLTGGKGFMIEAKASKKSSEHSDLYAFQK